MFSEFYGKDKRLSVLVAFCFVFVRLNLSKVGSGGGTLCHTHEDPVAEQLNFSR